MRERAIHRTTWLPSDHKPVRSPFSARRASEGSGFLGVGEGNADVASQAAYPRALHGAAIHRRLELSVRTRGERRQIDPIPCDTRLPGSVGRTRRYGIPRTDVLADVATVDVRADRRTKAIGDVAAILDRQVRDALRRVEDTWTEDGLRWTRLDAERAGAALVERRRIDLQRQAANDRGEEDEGSVLGADEA